MTSLALRNLLHDKVRTIVTLTGIVFSVVLVGIQVGLFLGFIATTANLIDHSGADLWIASSRIPFVEVGVPFSERKLYQVRATRGIAQAEKLNIRFSQWKRPDGGQASAEIVGFDPASGLGGPWNLVEGSIAELKRPDTVMIDQFYSKKLGVTHLGQIVEIRNHRARIAGFTSGIRTFTTSPLVFTSFKNSIGYTLVSEDQTVFILAKAKPGMDLDRLKADLLARVPDVDVCTTREFSWRTSRYWMLGTGAGATLIFGAVLGLAIGFAVVAQTIYAATVDHIREFGTLKAIGASNNYIYLIILKQAAASAVAGYVVGIALVLCAASLSRYSGAALLVPSSMAAALFVLTLAMSLSAALLSINRVMRIDPAMVFKG